MSDPQRHSETGAGVARGVLVIVLAGAALGIAFNLLQHRGNPARALAWIREDRRLASLEEVTAIDASAWPDTAATAAPSRATAEDPRPVAPDAGSKSAPRPAPTSSHAGPASPADPPASKPPAPVAGDPGPQAAIPPAAGATAEPARATPAIRLPHIPDTRDPLEVQLATVKRFYDAGAALVVDARTREEYAQKHIAGAVNLPFDDTFRDPSLVTSFQSGGKPVIIYCGGGDCELSKNLAYALIEAGQRKLLVFMGGLPEWENAGYPIATGATP